MTEPQVPWLEIWRHLSDAPPLQLVFIALSMLTWIIGGNCVSIAHSRRMGRPWSMFENPFRMFIEFNASEWAHLAIVFVISWSFCALAILAG